MDDALQDRLTEAAGLRRAAEERPLHAASANYFRLARSVWEPALESLRALGAHYVDIAVPWNVHEQAPGVFDFGENNPRLDVRGFIELAASVGLRSILRLGPTLASELPFDGIPERVVWDEACMSRTQSGAPRLRAALPVAFPAPSYASRAFHDHAAVFLRAVAERLAPLSRRDGPIALAIVGDEQQKGALPDGLSGGDHHPDAIEQYRRFLKHRYRGLAQLRRVHGPDATFDRAVPPSEDRADDPRHLGPHLDWLEAREAMVEGAFYRYRSVLDRHGLRDIAKIYEVPAEGTLATVDPARMARVASGVSLECRAPASEDGRRSIAKTMSAAAVRGAARNEPVFVSRTFVGSPAGGAVRADADDLFVAMTALAYGARGIGLHEGVQRDRWIGGPIDVHGRARPSAAAWRQLFAALEGTEHAKLSRLAPVRIAVPRALSHLGLLSSAVAPFAPELLGATENEHAVEGVAGTTNDALAETRAFVRALETALEHERIPYAFIPAESIERSLGDAAWTVVACPGALDGLLLSAVSQHLLVGKAVSVGPRAPERDGHFIESSGRLPAIQHPVVPLVLPRGPATLTELVRTAAKDLALATLPAEPEVVRTTLHVDPTGAPRSLFVLNPGDEELVARVSAPRAKRAVDAMSGEPLAVTEEAITLTLPARTVRLLALATNS